MILECAWNMVGENQSQSERYTRCSRSTALKNAKLEMIIFIREKVRKLVGQETVTIDLLLDLIFGNESEIWLAFSKQ